MNRLEIIIIMLVVLMLPGIGQAFNVAGVYDSSEGVLTLKQSADRITGRYTKDNGELTGLMFDNIFEGFWIEDGSDRRCSTPKNGRYHWGRVTLVFTGNGFSGRWSHCDDTPSRAWTATRRGGHHSAPPPSGNADPFAVSTDNPNIEGLWGSSEGEIRFRQQGNRIAGRYPNDNGEIVGVLKNDTLSGYWIEDNSAQRCSTPKNGRYHWGRIEFVFSGNRFSGKYAYCDGELKSPWGGERKQ